jgi:hypothetical protein
MLSALPSICWIAGSMLLLEKSFSPDMIKPPLKTGICLECARGYHKYRHFSDESQHGKKRIIGNFQGSTVRGFAELARSRSSAAFAATQNNLARLFYESPGKLAGVEVIDFIGSWSGNPSGFAQGRIPHTGTSLKGFLGESKRQPASQDEQKNPALSVRTFPVVAVTIS